MIIILPKGNSQKLKYMVKTNRQSTLVHLKLNIGKVIRKERRNIKLTKWIKTNINKANITLTMGLITSTGNDVSRMSPEWRYVRVDAVPETSGCWQQKNVLEWKTDDAKEKNGDRRYTKQRANIQELKQWYPHQTDFKPDHTTPAKERHLIITG